MNTDGSRVRRLTDNEAFDGQPNWSPNGRKISFQSYREGQLSIYTMRDDGGDQKRLTYDVPDAFGSAWSPNGRIIAHSSFSAGEIFTINVDGSDSRNLTNNPSFDFAPDWQPLPRKATEPASTRTLPRSVAAAAPVTCKAPPSGRLAALPGLAAADALVDGDRPGRACSGPGAGRCSRSASSAVGRKDLTMKRIGLLGGMSWES